MPLANTFARTHVELTLYDRAELAHARLMSFERNNEDDDETFHTETTFMCAVMQLLEAGRLSPDTEEQVKKWLTATENFCDEHDLE